jgi:hypothetical protein
MSENIIDSDGYAAPLYSALQMRQTHPLRHRPLRPPQSLRHFHHHDLQRTRQTRLLR